MTPGEIGLFISISVGLLGITGALIKAITVIVTLCSDVKYLRQDVDQNRKTLESLSQLNVKVDALWDTIMKRAASEVIAKGLGTMNSPIRISDFAKEWVSSKKEELGNIHAAVGGKADDHQLAVQIGQQLGDWLLREVAIPHKICYEAGLLIALRVAKEEYCERMGLPSPEELGPPSSIHLNKKDLPPCSSSDDK